MLTFYCLFSTVTTSGDVHYVIPREGKHGLRKLPERKGKRTSQILTEEMLKPFASPEMYEDNCFNEPVKYVVSEFCIKCSLIG